MPSIPLRQCLLPSQFYAFFCARSSQDISTTKVAGSMPSTSSFYCLHPLQKESWTRSRSKSNSATITKHTKWLITLYISHNMIQWCNARYMFIIFANSVTNCCLLSLCLFLCCLKVGGGQAKTRCQRAHISPPSAAFRSYEDETTGNHWKFDSLASNSLKCHNAQQP